jgi:hypothetical protein
MTPAAILRLAILASLHALTEAELLGIMRACRKAHADTPVPVATVEREIAAVIAARARRAA